MKLLPALLLNLVLVGGGILLYDTLKGRDEAPPQEQLMDRSEASGASSGLTGSAHAVAAHSSEARIRGLEAAIAGLQAEVERLRTGQGARTAAVQDPQAPIQIDEQTLRWLTAYRQAILKREGEARQRARMAVEFERKGVRLPGDQMESVVRATMVFLDRARELARRPRDPSPAGQAEFQRAARELRNEYELTLTRLVPAEQVELILKTRVARAEKILPEDDE